MLNTEGLYVFVLDIIAALNVLLCARWEAGEISVCQKYLYMEVIPSLLTVLVLSAYFCGNSYCSSRKLPLR